MPTIGSVELLVILLVAFLVVGPRELPTMMRTVGGWVKRMRVMAMEFQHNLDAVVREADLEDLKNDAMAIKREADEVRHSISQPLREATQPLSAEELAKLKKPAPGKTEPATKKKPDA